jgi:hypothetical protein
MLVPRTVVFCALLAPSIGGSSSEGADVMLEIPVEQIRITARRFLKAGDTFRVKRGTGPSAKDGREVSRIPAGVYLARRLFRCSAWPARFYCEATDVNSGRVHTIYVHGPRFSSPHFEGVTVRPYGIKLVQPEGVRTVRKRKVRAHV